MEKVNIYCNHCGKVLNPEDEFQALEFGFIHDECLITVETHWWSELTMDELIEIINRADQYRYSDFFVSYISPNYPLLVSKEPHNYVFSVRTTRQEVIDALEKKKNA